MEHEAEVHGPTAICHGGPLSADARVEMPLALVLERAALTSAGITYLQPQGVVSQSYAEVFDRAQRILGGLSALGAQPGDKLILQLTNNPSFIELLWACFLGGFIPVPLAPALSYAAPNRKATQLLQTQQLLKAPIIVTNRELQPSVQAFVERHALDSSNGTAGSEGVQVAIAESLRESPLALDWMTEATQGPALILMTSGSTGMPKGVMLSAQNLLVSAAGMASVNRLSATDITLNWMPLEHVASLVMFHFTEVWLGCQQIQVDNNLVLQNPLRWLDLIEQYRATVTWAPNFAYGLVNDQAEQIQQRQWDLSSMRWMGNGAEAVVGKTTARFLELLQPSRLAQTAVSPGYGMTETCSGIVHSHRFSAEREFVEVGTPIPGVSIRIVDDHDQVLEEGQIGALQVQGLTVTAGYYGQPTVDIFTADGWFRTGDLGFLQQGRLTIAGREKDVIVINGVNYYAHEIEAVVEELEGVAVSFTAACAVSHSDQDTDQLAIFFHPDSFAEPERVVLLKQIRKAVSLAMGISPDYLIPVEREAIPKTAVGKIQHQPLREQFQSGQFKEVLSQLEALQGASGPDRQPPRNQVEQQLAEIWQGVLKRSHLSIYDNFFELGGTSLLLVQVLSQIQSHLQVDLSVVELFQYPTIDALAPFLSQDTVGDLVLEKARSRGQKRRQIQSPDIAVIGLACRFPGAETAEQFWQNLCDGVESITFFTDEEVLASGVDPQLLQQPNYVKASPILGEIETFDADFFGYTPKEAELIDPQQRLLLECAWESLEDAGYDPWGYGGSIGLYAGASMNTFLLNNVYPNRHRLDTHDPMQTLTLSSMGGFQMTVANDKDYLTTRVSYKLNLRGPSVNVQTACSTSLVAIHMASQSLINGECDMALAGGVSVHSPQKVGHLYQEGMILTPDGHCRAFDAKAQGTLFGSGAGLVVLKRLEDAIASQDQIYAVIKGSALGNDGGQKMGYLAPQAEGQTVVAAEAMAMAEVAPDSIGYVEAHGTGTELGDPIEISALTQAFRAETQKKQFCAIGSVKTNVGHLNIASGIVGFIKTTLAIQHQKIPASLHFETPNPRIDFERSPFFVNTQLRDWPEMDTPRRAGINSLGIGGSNVHAILEEAPDIQRSETTDRPIHLFTLSAKTEQALKDLVQKSTDFFHAHPELPLGDVCFTRNVGRAHFGWRRAIATSSLTDLTHQLETGLAGTEANGYQGQIEGKTPKIAILFTGQGSRYVGMGQDLYKTQPIFRQAIDDCDQILQQHLQTPLLDVLYPLKSPHPSPLPLGEGTREDLLPSPFGAGGEGHKPLSAPQEQAATLIDQTAHTQPALFVLEYALYQLWQSWGVQPTAVMGHSIGEYVAACIAGVFSLEDALKLVAARGRLMQSLPANGGMVSVMADEATVLPFLDNESSEVAIAAINGPESLVLSGERTAIAQIVETLTVQDIKTTFLNVSHGFHSPLMEPMLSEFEQVARQVTYHPPQIDLISNLTGERIGEQIATPEYWCRHIRQPVQFAASMSTLAQMGIDIFLECGPKPVLLGMARSLLEHPSNPTPQSKTPNSELKTPNSKLPLYLPSLRPQQDDWQVILSSLGQLYVRGVAIAWQNVDQGFDYRRISLPTYPFQRKRFWMDPPPPQPLLAKTSGHPLLGQPISTPLQQHLFQAQVSAERPAYLQDHQVNQTPIFPGAAFIEMALAAGKKFFGSADNLTLNTIAIEQALPLTSTVDLQTVVEQTETGLSFQIFSQACNASSDAWQRHCTGSIVKGTLPSEASIDLAALQQQFSQKPVEQHYADCQAIWLNYGPQFQAIVDLWVTAGEALAKVQLPDSLADAQYCLHPVLLDACCQAIFAALPDGDRSTLLPISLEALTLYASPSQELWSHVQLRSVAETVSADVRLYRPDGQQVVAIAGLVAKKLGVRWSSTGLRPSLFQTQQPWQNWLYQVDWRLKEIRSEAVAMKPGQWLIFADQGGIGQQLANCLTQQDQQVTLVSPGAPSASSIHQIDPQDPQALLHLLETLQAQSLPLRGVIHLWSLDAVEGNEVTSAALQKSCGSALTLIQGLLKGTTLPRLWFVTKGTQRVGDEQLHPVGLMQAPLWGMVKTLALEHPEFDAVVVDLAPLVLGTGLGNAEGVALAPPAPHVWGESRERLAHSLQASGESSELLEYSPQDWGGRGANAELNVSHGRQSLRDEHSMLWAEICGGEPEPLVAWRGDRRFVARLISAQISSERQQQRQTLQAAVSSRLVITERGTLENLRWQPLARRQPQPGEVEIQVRVTGLNFRDVLNVLDLYPSDPGPLGLECSGKIVALGEGVSGYQIGDEVVAIASPAFSQHVTTSFFAPKPKSLSDPEAATIPVAFMTAHYALNHLAKIGPDDRILIHSAAGGVGQAAVQIAQQAGAEIFATASEGKWDWLRSQNIQHIFNSRTADFVEDIQTLTKGKGVTIVLNSLAGEFIPQSLAVMTHNGHFLEIGKQGIWEPEQVAQQRPDLTYSIIDLMETMEREPEKTRSLLQEVIAQFQNAAPLTLKPLPHRSFPAAKVVDAFRYMQQAKQIGKVVVEQSVIPIAPEAASNPLARIATGTVLITGGLGDLGLLVAQWLIDQGAKHLILVGRSGVTEKVRSQVQALKVSSAMVETVQADVADTEAMAQVFKQIPANYPLLGVVHAAGVLDDGVLRSQTWNRLESVLKAKVDGAWTLHQLTADLDLDFFVLFSSAASLLGSAGQANYAAASAAIDTLAQARQNIGLPALSINWGPWDQLGLATRINSGLEGMERIEPETGLAVLDYLLRQSWAQVGVLPINESRWAVPAGLTAFWSELRIEKASGSDLLSELERVTDRRALLMEYLQSEVARLLGVDGEEGCDPDIGFTDLGLDSLTTVELRNRLQTALERSLPSTVIYDYPTLGKLTDYLLTQLFPTDSEDEPVQTEPASIDVQQLSEADAEAILLQQLEQLE
ncbi:MAG: SDR family NAD(P)-dependent oxidoreductase [Thermosynechococcaceae cyanobacterium]